MPTEYLAKCDSYSETEEKIDLSFFIEVIGLIFLQNQCWKYKVKVV